jgi:hypothetical protein
MTIGDLLQAERASILDEALRAVSHLEHYQRAGERLTRARLDALYAEVTAAVERLDLSGLLAHASAVASARFERGYELGEIWSAFHALEVAICRRAAARLPEAERAWAAGLVATALRHGKDALGRTYGALAAPGPSIDLTPLFRGAPQSEDRAAGERVYPV